MTGSGLASGLRARLRLIDRPVIAMFGLGLSSGLPIMLVGSTFQFWLRDLGFSIAAIGLLSWFGFAYTFKFAWSPLIDQVRLPGLHRVFGRHRAWILLMQGLIIVGLAMLAALGDDLQASEGAASGSRVLVGSFLALAAMTAIASATQDIAIDSWRIEVSHDAENSNLYVVAQAYGYRLALLTTTSLIFFIVDGQSWAVAYAVMAGVALASVGVTLAAPSPTPDATANAPRTTEPDKVGFRAIADMWIKPLADFLSRYGRFAVIILLALSFFRLGDFIMGPMIGPLYNDLALDESLIGQVRGTTGLIATIIGVGAAGFFAGRFGHSAALLLGALLGPLSNLAFSYIAIFGVTPLTFHIVMAIDNVSGGFAGAILIIWMSNLTSIGFSATQYALLSSTYSLLGQFSKGSSGFITEFFQTMTTVNIGYALFFVFSSILCIPALVFIVLVFHHQKRIAERSAGPSSGLAPPATPPRTLDPAAAPKSDP